MLKTLERQHIANSPLAIHIKRNLWPRCRIELWRTIGTLHGIKARSAIRISRSRLLRRGVGPQHGLNLLVARAVEIGLRLNDRQSIGANAGDGSFQLSGAHVGNVV